MRAKAKHKASIEILLLIFLPKFTQSALLAIHAFKALKCSNRFPIVANVRVWFSVQIDPVEREPLAAGGEWLNLTANLEERTLIGQLLMFSRFVLQILGWFIMRTQSNSLWPHQC
ncbi:MAG: hypothetical protein C0486_08455 [Erythrobacter sp.]|nr:hypothetical protein [Erythrobacter sp.]MBA4081508.1 hypothetical protein [Erythrobacter sp.]